MPLQIRRGTEAQRQTLASPPQAGELVWVTDDQKLYIGDGATLLRNLSPITGFGAEDAADTIGAILQDDSTHSGISFAYNDSAGTINATVSLDQFRNNVTMGGFDLTGSGNINITGNVTANRFVGDYQGSVSADDSTVLVNAVDGEFNLNGTVGTDIIPTGNEEFDIGSNTNRFKDIYLSGSTIYLGTAQISLNGSGGVDLPANSTISGGPIGGAGAGQQLNVDIVGDDSSIIVNSSTGKVTGVFEGDVTGSVFALDSTNLVDAIEGTVKLDNGEVSFDGNIIRVISNVLQVGELSETVSTEVTSTSVDGTAPFVGLAKAGTGLGNSALFTMRGLHGSDPENPVQASAGDYIGGFSTASFDPDSTVNDYIGNVLYLGTVDNNTTPTIGEAKGKAIIATNGGSYSAASFNYLTFDSQGRCAINQQDAQATLDVNGFAKLSVLTAEPASPANGMIAIADGTTWDPAGTGKSVMVVYLAGGWRTAATAP